MHGKYCRLKRFSNNPRSLGAKCIRRWCRRKWKVEIDTIIYFYGYVVGCRPN